MVRLLQSPLCDESQRAQQFQSHNGAIAAMLQALIAEGATSFNPTMVRLLPPRYLLNRQPIPSFNPTMVRLLQHQTKYLPKPKNLFQSHNGAIAARGVGIGSVLRAVVSIPQWCDCCPKRNQATAHHPRRFNPTMVRLLRGCDGRVAGIGGSFNPTMVRLLPQSLTVSSSK